MMVASAAAKSSTPFFPGAWPDPSDSGHTDASSLASTSDAGNLPNTLDPDESEHDASSAHRTPKGPRIPGPALRIHSGNEKDSRDIVPCDQVLDSQAAPAATQSSSGDSECVKSPDVMMPLSTSVSHDSCTSEFSVTTVSSL